MSGIGKIFTGVATAVGGLAGGALASVISGAFKGKPKAPHAPLPLPTATPRANSAVSDALLSRRGSAANQRTGRGGAESGAGTKKTLMGQ